MSDILKTTINFANSAAKEHGIIGGLFEAVDIKEEGEFIVCSINGSEIIAATMTESDKAEPSFILDYAMRDENSKLVATEHMLVIEDFGYFIQTYILMLAFHYLSSLVLSIRFSPEDEE